MGKIVCFKLLQHKIHFQKTKKQNEQVRQDINIALQDLYNFIEKKNNFEIDYLNNPYLEREFNGEINALIAVVKMMKQIML